MEETGISKPWLKIEPSRGLLIPKQEAVITITLLIDNKTAIELNAGRCLGLFHCAGSPTLFLSRLRLEDTLVLHMENGGDCYLTVSADFARSCFGATLSQLNAITEPIRHVKLSSDSSAAAPDAFGSDAHPVLSIPKVPLCSSVSKL